MTLLAMWSWDLGFTPPDFGGVDSFTLDTTTKKTGVASCRIGGGNVRYKDITASSDVTFGSAIYQEAITSGTAAALSFSGDGGVTNHISIGVNLTTKLWEVRRGVVPGATFTGGTLLATSAVAQDASAWRYIEARCTIHDSTGRVQLWVDGILVIDFTGDTKNAGTNSTIDRVTMASFAVISSTYTYYDDTYIINSSGSVNNARLGEIDVRVSLPTGNGSSSQLLGSDGNSTDNYLLVDESPPSFSDYVASATAAQKDLYAIADAPANAADILGVRAFSRAAKIDPGSASFKHLTKANGSTKTDDTVQAASITERMYYGVIQELDPSGADWTVSNFNGAEVGVEIS